MGARPPDLNRGEHLPNQDDRLWPGEFVDVILTLANKPNAIVVPSQAVQTVADLIGRHGQGAYAGCPPEDDHDNAFLIADRQEAYLLAACGGHWAVQQVAAVRALNESCHLRQDWDRISPGLSSLAIERGCGRNG